MTDYTALFKTQPDYEKLAEAFDSIEADITYSDDKDIIRYFSPYRIFSRPASCLNADLYACHPENVHAVVKDILDAFRDGSKDKVTYQNVSNDNRAVRVCYQAMRDPKGAYLGCLEVATYRD